MVVQWLGLRAGDMGLIPGQGTKTLHDVWSGKYIYIRQELTVYQAQDTLLGAKTDKVLLQPLK